MADREFDVDYIDGALEEPSENDDDTDIDYPDKEDVFPLYDKKRSRKSPGKISTISPSSTTPSESKIKKTVDLVLGESDNNYNDALAYIIDEYLNKGKPYPRKHKDVIEYIIKYMKEH